MMGRQNASLYLLLHLHRLTPTLALQAKNIVSVCHLLREKHGGDIPSTFEGLLELPGVGPKMATLTMAYGWGQIVGITVDTHVSKLVALYRGIEAVETGG